jgi:hypothetical protein
VNRTLRTYYNIKIVEVQICEVDTSALLISGLELFNIVGFPWLHHIPSSADAAMGTNACNLPKAVKLYYIKLN